MVSTIDRSFTSTASIVPSKDVIDTISTFSSTISLIFLSYQSTTSLIPSDAGKILVPLFTRSETGSSRII